MVIKSSGMLNQPITPKITSVVSMFGKTAIKATFIERNITNKTTKRAQKTKPSVIICEANKRCKIDRKSVV